MLELNERRPAFPNDQHELNIRATSGQENQSQQPGTGTSSRLRRRLIALDVVALSVAWTAAYAVVPGHPRIPAGVRLADVTIVVACTLGLIAAHGLYLTRVSTSKRVATNRLVRTSIAAAATSLLVGQLWQGQTLVARSVIGGALTLLLVAMFRHLFDVWLATCRLQGRFDRPVVLVASDTEAPRVLEFLAEHPEAGMRVVGVVGPRAADRDTDGKAADGDATTQTEDMWLGSLADAVPAVHAAGATGVVVVVAGLPTEELNDVVRRCTNDSVHVHVWHGLWGVATRRLHAVPVAHEPFLYLAPPSLSQPQLVAKRVLDVALASLLLILTLPVVALAAIGIKHHDGGPVFFRQRRVGRDGREFTLVKLRTMVTNAEAQLPELAASNEREGPLFKLTNDPRVTPLGGKLRSSSIDELPQLWNVLKGDMSLVGPRPALPAEVARFDDELLTRQRVRPGVTGLWQVGSRDRASFTSYRRLDLFYVENWSIGFDLAILFETVPAVILRALSSLRPRGPVGPTIAHPRRPITKEAA